MGGPGESFPWWEGLGGQSPAQFLPALVQIALKAICLEHFAFENALQAMRRHGLPPRRRRRNVIPPSTPKGASEMQNALKRWMIGPSARQPVWPGLVPVTARTACTAGIRPPELLLGFEIPVCRTCMRSCGSQADEKSCFGCCRSPARWRLAPVASQGVPRSCPPSRRPRQSRRLGRLWQAPLFGLRAARLARLARHGQPAGRFQGLSRAVQSDWPKAWEASIASAEESRREPTAGP